MIPLSSSPGTNNAATQAHDIARQAEAALSRGRFEEAVSLHRQAAALYHQATSHTSNPESIRALNLLSSAQNSKASELERLLCPTPTSSTQTFVPQSVSISTTAQEKSSKFPTISPRSLSSPNFTHSDFYYSQQHHPQQHENSTNNNNYQHSPLIDSPLPSPSSSSSSSSNCISPHSHSRPNVPVQTSSNTNPLASSMYEEENMLFIYPYNSESNNETISSLSESTDLSSSQHLTTESSTADQIFLLCSKDKTNNNNNNNNNGLGLLSSSPPSPESSRFWLGLEKLLDILPKPIFGQKYNTSTGNSTSEPYSENLNDKSSLMNSFYMVPSSSSSHKATPTPLTTTTTTTTTTTATQSSPQNTQSAQTSQLRDSGNLHLQTSNLRGSGTINTNEDQFVKLQRENKHLQHVIELLNAQLSKGAQVKKENELLKQSILQFREEVQRKASLSRSVLYPSSSSSSVVPNNTTSSSSSSCVDPSFGKFSSSVPVPIIDNNSSRERDGGSFPSSSPAHPQLFQFSPSSSPQSPSPLVFKTEVPQNITPEQRIKALEDRVVTISRELEEKDNIIRMYENRFGKLNIRKSGTQNPQSQSTVIHTNGLLLNNSTQSLTKSTL